MGSASSSSSTHDGGDDQQQSAYRKVAGGEGGISLRQHKHMYLVLGSPMIKYTGHPGRGPLMFQTQQFLGDSTNSNVEAVEGFQLYGSVSLRPEPPTVVPSASNPHVGVLKFAIDVAECVNESNPMLVEAFVSGGNVHMDPQGSGFVIGTARATSSSAAAAARPNSPFGSHTSRVFSQGVFEGSKRCAFSTGEFPLSAVKDLVTRRAEGQGHSLPIEGPVIFRLSWSTKSSNNDDDAAGHDDDMRTTSTRRGSGGGGRQQQLQQQHEHQLLSFWDVPADKSSSSSSSASSSSADVIKLKPYTSRFLFTEGTLLRVDDVFDLAGDDDVVIPPPAAGGGGASTAGRQQQEGDDRSDDDNDGSGGSTSASPVRGSSTTKQTPSRSTANSNAVDAAADSLQAVASPDGGNECVVCLENPRNALLLPCRHLCLCTGCAPMLRQQSNKCPVCRTAIAKVVAVG